MADIAEAAVTREREAEAAIAEAAVAVVVTREAVAAVRGEAVLPADIPPEALRAAART